MARLSPSDLYRFSVPSDPRLRPDAGAVAYVVTSADRESDENRTAIWLAVPGEEPRRLTYGPADSCPRWSPDGRVLAFSRAVDGVAQVHLLPMDGGEPRALTSAPLGAGAPVWSPDGTAIAYQGPCGEVDPNAPVVADRLDYKADGVGLLRGLTMQVSVVDVATGESRQVTSGDFHAGEPCWSPDGRRVFFVADLAPDRDLVVGGQVYAVDVAGGEAGGEAERLTDGDVICTDVWCLGGRLLVAGLVGGPVGHTRLFWLGLDGGGLTEVETGLDRNVMPGAPGYPGAEPQLAGDDLIFCARDRGRTHVYRAPGEKIIGGDQVVSGVGVAGGRVAYVAATPRSAGDVYLLDLGAAPGDAVRLTDHELPGVEVYAPRSRTFTAPDGTSVEGFVLRDEGRDGPGPLLLDAHGGPHNAWAPVLDTAHLYHQALVARGWTVLLVNPRGSDGYGEAFFRGVVGAWGIADAGDFLAAVDELVAEGVADPERLAVTGYSYGGYISCWLPARTGRFKAAIAGGCVSDLASEKGTSDLGHLLTVHECGDDLAAQSPMTYVADVGTPTLLLHGENDDRCPIGQAEQWFAALRERGVPARLVRYPGASHLFILNGRPSHRVDYNERILQWLEQWISTDGTAASAS
jgi:dipeptidyl aminopeptidase/acylaminoacyl peptidase